MGLFETETVVQTDGKEPCFLCNTKHDETELKKVKEGYICKQCIHYRNVAKAIIIPSAIVIYFIIHGLAFLILYNTPLTFVLLPGPLIWFFIIRACINPIARSLSTKKNRKSGIYHDFDFINCSDTEKKVIESYRVSPQSIKEDVLLYLNVGKISEDKRGYTPYYTMQEEKLLIAYHYSSKDSKNKINEKLNIEKEA